MHEDFGDLQHRETDFTLESYPPLNHYADGLAPLEDHALGMLHEQYSSANDYVGTFPVPAVWHPHPMVQSVGFILAVQNSRKYRRNMVRCLIVDSALQKYPKLGFRLLFYSSVSNEALMAHVGSWTIRPTQKRRFRQNYRML